jgi:hypothetical protein
MDDVTGKLMRDPMAKRIGFGLRLPPLLDPNRSDGRDDDTAVRLTAASIPRLPGTPRALRKACEKSVLAAADGYGVIRVETESYGLPWQAKDGNVVAPIYTKVVYWRSGGYEIRQAPVQCVTDGSGKVVALGDAK